MLRVAFINVRIFQEDIFKQVAPEAPIMRMAK